MEDPRGSERSQANALKRTLSSERSQANALKRMPSREQRSSERKGPASAASSSVGEPRGADMRRKFKGLEVGNQGKKRSLLRVQNVIRATDDWYLHSQRPSRKVGQRRCAAEHFHKLGTAPRIAASDNGNPAPSPTCHRHGLRSANSTAEDRNPPRWGAKYLPQATSVLLRHARIVMPMAAAGESSPSTGRTTVSPYR